MSDLTCPHCEKEIDVPDYVWGNVDRYHNSAITVTRCCRRGIRVIPKICYTIIPAPNTIKQDDWAQPLVTDKI